MLIIIVFVVLFVVAMAAAVYLLGELENAVIPALVVSSVGTGAVAVGLSDTDRTFIIIAVASLAAAIIFAAFIIVWARRR